MASEPITTVLNALERVGARGLMTKPNERWQFHCPAHEDRNPSLTVTRKPDGTVLLHCHAGCSTEAVLAALGLTVKDLFPNAPEIRPREQKNTSAKNPTRGKNISEHRDTNGKVYPTARDALKSYGLGKPAKWWAYRDANGDVVMVVARWNTPDGKEIRPVYRTPSGWQPGALPPPRPLYRLPELLQADSDTPVIVVEGEKCVDAVVELGFIATTSSGGANAAKQSDWTPLAGREVWLIPDFDEAGTKYAKDVTELVYAAGARAVKILPLDVLFPRAKETIPQGFDIADVVAGFREDANAAELLEGVAERIRLVAANTPPEPRPGDAPAGKTGGSDNTPRNAKVDFDIRPIVVWLKDVELELPQWLWPHRIPIGCITAVVGKPGVGKSCITLDFAARVSTGTPWPDGTPCEKGSVLIVTLEDNPSRTIKPRLEAMHGDGERVAILTGAELRNLDGSYSERCVTLGDLYVIEKTLEYRDDWRLIIIDPVGDFLGWKVDSHRDNEVRAVLAPLAKLARRHKVAVLLVIHRRKSAGDGGADDTAMGSRAFTGLARSVWHVFEDANDEERRLFLPGKQNLAKKLPGLAFRIVGESPWARVEWEREPVNMTADDGLEAERQASRPGPEADALEDAKAFLLTALKDGPRPAKDVRQEWVEAHCGSEKTLTRAKTVLGIQSYREKVPGPWWWKLPEKQDAQEGQDALTQRTWPSWPSLEKNGVSELSSTQEGQDAQDGHVIRELGHVAPGGTETRNSPPPKVVDVEEVNRRLMEAGEEDAEWESYVF